MAIQAPAAPFFLQINGKPDKAAGDHRAVDWAEYHVQDDSPAPDPPPNHWPTRSDPTTVSPSHGLSAKETAPQSRRFSVWKDLNSSF